MTARLGDNLDVFFNKGFQRVEKQLTFASVLAANEIAKSVMAGVEKQLEKDIDRPTPFTKRAFKITRATKKNPVATVGIKPIQAEYLKYQISGGTRHAKAIVIPSKGATNRYGNLPRGKLKKLEAQGKSFIADGVVVQRMKRKNKAIAYVGAKKATYKKRFKFFERARNEARVRANKHVTNSIRKALATAR